jgi:DNA topoisomerase-2
MYKANTTTIRREQTPNLRFGKLAIASDADVDGYHIAGLVINLFDKFWPELIEAGFIHVLRTPVVMVTLKDKSELEFFTEREYKEWEAGPGASLKGWSMKYFKGLSSWKTPQFAKFLQNPDRYLFALEHEDEEDAGAIDLAFNATRAADRRDWLVTGATDFEDFIKD